MDGDPIEVRAGLLKAVARHAARERMRYALNGILVHADPEVDPKGHFHLVATDGRAMLVLTLARAVAVPKTRQVIPADVLPRMAAGDIVRIQAEEGVASPPDKNGVTKSTLRFPYMEGAYPDWREVVPKDSKPSEKALFNPRYIGRACRAFEEILGKSLDNRPATAFHLNGDHGPSLITMSKSPISVRLDDKRDLEVVSIRALVMPMLVD